MMFPHPSYDAPPQAPAPQEPSVQKPAVVLRATTRLVQVNVVVQDKKGNFVTGLEKDDFVLEDGGKRQEIRVFGVESSKAPAVPETVTASGVISNRRAGPAGGVTIILLDGLNTSWGDQAVVRQQVLKYLTQIEPEDHVALYALGRKLEVLHDYTKEPRALAKALELYAGRSSAELTASFQPSIEEIAQLAESMATSPEEAAQAAETIQGIINALKEEEFFFQSDRILTTLNAFESIANHLAGLPGRKNLVWVSGSFPLELGYFERPDLDRGTPPEISGSPNSARYGSGRTRRGVAPAPVMVKHGRSRTFDGEFVRTVHALNAANLSVYPVDARSLSSNPLASQNISTMKSLANDTGGKAYYNTNDIMNSVREAIADSQASYTLAYYPSEQKLDGRYRRIKVTVKRPGLVIRHRKGYFDVDQASADEGAQMAAIQQVVWSPLDATGISLEVELGAAGAASQDTLPLRVKVDLSGITLEQYGDFWRGKLDFFLVQTDSKGREHESRSQTIGLQFPKTAYEAVMARGYGYREEVRRVKDATALRIVVRDASSGNTGRVVIPFDDTAR